MAPSERRHRWQLGALLAIGTVAVGLLGRAAFVDRAGPSEAPAPAVTPPAEVATSDEPIGEAPIFLQESSFEDFRLLSPDADPPVGLEGIVVSLSDLQIPMTRRTQRYVEWFASDQDGKTSFIGRFKRGARYREYIERELLLRGLPQDLVWVAAIESGFRPQATSRAGAAGLFQMMPPTALRFGLAMGEKVDERRGVRQSTRAAIDYLDFLYERFGNWDLALAAYNCGEGCVDEALEKGRALIGDREDPIQFHELAEARLLPKETSEYVPMIHAFAVVAHNRAQLGLDEFELPEAMRFAEIAVPAGTPLAWISQASDLTLAELREYNPDLLADTVGEGKGEVIVMVPSARLAQTVAALPSILYGTAEKSGEEVDPEDPPEDEPPPPSTSGPAIALSPIPGKEGSYLLPSGVVAVLERTGDKDILISPTIRTHEGGGAREVPIDARRTLRGVFEENLLLSQRDLLAKVRSEVAPRLYERVRAERLASYQRTGLDAPFTALSKKMFRLGHPLSGQLLVGPTKGPTELIVDTEPTWSIEATYHFKGFVDRDRMAPILDTHLKDPTAPKRLPRLPETAQVLVTPDGASRLIGWGSHPVAKEQEAALKVAFFLACGARIGRVPLVLKADQNWIENLDCALEQSPSGYVAWVLASPRAKVSGDDLERAILGALVGLTGNGPSEDEIEAAKDALRDLMNRRRREALSDREPRRAIIAECDRVLGGLEEVSRDQVIEASRHLFSVHHRVTVTFGPPMRSAP